MTKKKSKKNEASITRSSAAEYLTFITATGKGASKPSTRTKMSDLARR